MNSNSSGKAKSSLTGSWGAMSVTISTITDRGTRSGIAPGQTPLGQTCFHAGAPIGTSGCLTRSSSPPGMRYPLFLKATPNGLSLGGRTWQVVQLVWYLRENEGIAET